MKNNKIPIPKRFQIMGKTIKVKWKNKLIHNYDAHGQASYRDGAIHLKPSNKNRPIPREQLERAFLHECLHHIYDNLNENDLRKNEKLIEQVSGLLHQIFVTAEYE